MSEAFVELGEAINDQRFVEVDLALRRGQHIDRDDAESYAYLLDARAVLEAFYNRYACELVHRTDGYFFLLPLGDKVPRRLLGIPEMIVGQAAALLYLDPATIERGGVLTKDDILSHLAAIMGTDALVSAFNPKRKRMDERVAQETVRQRTTEALRKLAQLGFVSQLDDGQIRLRGALMRFADPVRGAGSPREALEKLIARGEIAVPEETGGDEAALDAIADTETQGDDNETQGDNDDTLDDVQSDAPLLGSASASNDDEFTYDSELPLEPEFEADEEDDDFAGNDVERSDQGDELDDDDVTSETDGSSEPQPGSAKETTTKSAEWDPTFDEFD